MSFTDPDIKEIAVVFQLYKDLSDDAMVLCENELSEVRCSDILCAVNLNYNTRIYSYSLEEQDVKLIKGALEQKIK